MMLAYTRGEMTVEIKRKEGYISQVFSLGRCQVMQNFHLSVL